MNINNFEIYINETILDRGYNYYIDGNIIETYSRNDNEYIFQIQGNQEYQVIVKIDDQGKIIYSECDCPYDFGPICKHQVAAYFELLEISNNKLTLKNQVTKLPEINEVLNTLSKENLIKIIIELTESNTTLKNNLILRYSKGTKEQELKKCKMFIESIVSKYTSREGFVSYNETYNFVNEMQNVLEKSRNTDDILLALDIAFLLLNESIEAFEYADDSNGNIGCLISQTIDLIKELLTDNVNLDIKLRENIFNKLIKESDNKIFDGWEDYSIDILSLCVKFADVECLRNKLIMKLKHNLAQNSNNAYERYNNEQTLTIMFQVINLYGTKEESLEFIKQNLKYSSFRELLIDKFIQEKNFYKVIELAIEGERQDKRLQGLVLKWKKIRYEAYKKLSLKEEQKILAKELILQGNFDYYKELKELITYDKTIFYNNLKQELKNNEGWYNKSIYLNLIVYEKDFDEIAEFVRENPQYIEQYDEILLERSKDEVIELYKKYIKLKAEFSSNRKNYQGVCRILRKYKKIAGKNNFETIVNELIGLYRKRPAFLDELSKIR
ncbi:hypothetical protein C3495_07135 [Clostridiaceae bacterium 14S0207]|nr:hypothetical protein C3495_07135 [Clostridiaceae bacterium 14S0207]